MPAVTDPDSVVRGNPAVNPGITGFVLAGGKSSRAGTNKALVPVKGRPLILYAIETLRRVCDRVVISSGDDVYGFTDCEVWPDLLPVRAPIIGIYSCLKRSGTGWNIFLSCDMPGVDPRLFTYLLTMCDGAVMVLPFHRGGMEPLCGLYSRKALPLLEEGISREQYGFQQFKGHSGVTLAEITPELEFYSPDLFTNLNTAGEIHFFSKE